MLSLIIHGVRGVGQSRVRVVLPNNSPQNRASSKKTHSRVATIVER